MNRATVLYKMHFDDQQQEWGVCAEEALSDVQGRMIHFDHTAKPGSWITNEQANTDQQAQSATGQKHETYCGAQ